MRQSCPVERGNQSLALACLLVDITCTASFKSSACSPELCLMPAAGQGEGFCGDDRFPVRAGDVVVFPPQSVHGIDVSEDARMYCLELMQPNDMFAGEPPISASHAPSSHHAKAHACSNNACMGCTTYCKCMMPYSGLCASCSLSSGRM